MLCTYCNKYCAKQCHRQTDGWKQSKHGHKFSCAAKLGLPTPASKLKVRIHKPTVEFSLKIKEHIHKYLNKRTPSSNMVRHI